MRSNFVTRAAVAAVAILGLTLVAGCGGGAGTSSTRVLERVKSTKVIRVGVKADSPPFGSMSKEYGRVGFDVEIIQAIVKELEEILGVKPIKIEWSTVTSKDRIPKVVADEIDLAIALTSRWTLQFLTSRMAKAFWSRRAVR